MRSFRFPATLLIIAAVAASGMGTPAGVSADTPMRFGKVRIYGNKKTKSYIIRREIPVKAGEPYDQARVDLGRKRLWEIPGIDYSEIRVLYTPIDSSITLDVRVTEKSSFHGAPIIQRGYENIYSFGLWVADDNFRGRSERISLSAMVRGNTVLGALWENPWIGQGPRFGIGIAGQYRDYRYVYDDLDGEFKDRWIRRGDGLFTLFYTFRSDLRITLGLGYEQAEGEIPGMTVKPDGDRYATVSLGARYDTRSSHLYPWSGWFIRAEVAGIGPGDEAYSILAGDLDTRLFVPVLGRTVFGVHAAAAVQDGKNIPIYLRKHLGGGWTIRGYDFGVFNATNSIVTGAEFRIPVNFSRDRTVEDLLFAWSVHLFADAGVVWEQDETPEPEMWHGGYGAGFLILNSWSRGLRVDYGWTANGDNRVHVEVGAKF